MGTGFGFRTPREDSLAPLRAETGTGMHPVPPSVQRFLLTYEGIFLVVLALGTGQCAQLQALPPPLSVRSFKSWARTT